MSKIDEAISRLKQKIGIATVSADNENYLIPVSIKEGVDIVALLEAAKAEQEEPGELPKSETHTEILQARVIVKDGVMTAKLEGYVVMPTPRWEEVCAETDRLAAENANLKQGIEHLHGQGQAQAEQIGQLNKIIMASIPIIELPDEEDLGKKE